MRHYRLGFGFLLIIIVLVVGFSFYHNASAVVTASCNCGSWSPSTCTSGALQRRICIGSCTLADMMRRCPTTTTTPPPTTPPTKTAGIARPDSVYPTVSGTTVTLYWSTVTGATGYIYQRYKFNSNNNAWVADGSAISRPTSPVSEVLTAGTYRYEVSAKNATETSIPRLSDNSVTIASTVASFTINTPTTGNFKVGEAWTLRITTNPALANQPVTLCLRNTVNLSQTTSCTPAGQLVPPLPATTDASGNWIGTGSFDTSGIGYWIEYAKVGSGSAQVISNDVSITVIAAPTVVAITYTPTGDWVRGTNKTVKWPTASFTTPVEVWLCTQSSTTASQTVAYTANHYCSIRLGYNLANTGSATFSTSSTAYSLYPYYFYVRKINDSANTYAGNGFSSDPVMVKNAPVVIPCTYSAWSSCSHVFQTRSYTGSCVSPVLMRVCAPTYAPAGDWAIGAIKTINWPISVFDSNIEVWLCTQSDSSSGLSVAQTANTYCRIRLGYNFPNTGSVSLTAPSTAIPGITYYLYTRKNGDSSNTYAGNGFSAPVKILAAGRGSSHNGQVCIDNTCVCVYGQPKRCGNPMQPGTGCPACGGPVKVGLTSLGNWLTASLGSLFSF